MRNAYNAPRVGVVIPFCNSKNTIGACLNAVAAFSPRPDRVLLIDDGSEDGSFEIARSYNFEVLRHARNLGRGRAKNTGINQLDTDLVVFIDSDVICPSTLIGDIQQQFTRYPKLAGMSAVTAPLNSFTNFASQYKSIYMHVILNRSAGFTDFSHGCVQAFKISELAAVRADFSTELHCDDIDLGVRLSQANRSLFLSPKLLPVHERYYSFRALLMNDFKVPFEFSQLIIRHGMIGNSLKKGRFAHASLAQVASLALTNVSVLCLAVGLAFDSRYYLATLLCLTNSAALNAPLLRACFRYRGLSFFLKAMAFTWLDHLVMSSGMTAGALSALKEKVVAASKALTPLLLTNESA